MPGRDIFVFAVVALLSALTLAVVFWSLWVRRHTWRCKWETAGTVNVALMAVALLLIIPPTGYIVGRWLHTATGIWNLQFFLAHVCTVCAAGALVYSAVAKLTGDEEFRTWLLRWIELPIGVGTGVMFLLFTGSRACCSRHGDFLTMHMLGPIVAAYWVFYCLLIMYLLYHGVRAFIDLRHDRPSRRLANVYLVASFMALIATVTRILTAAVWALQTAIVMDVTLVSTAAAISLFSWGAAYNWIRRTRYLTGCLGDDADDDADQCRK